MNPRRVRVTIFAATAALLAVMSNATFAGEPVTIRGIVADPEGEPLVDVTVSVVAEGSQTEVTTQSEKEGRFSIEVPDADLVYLFRFEKEGFGVKTAKFRPDPDDPRPVGVTLVPEGEGGESTTEPVSEISEARQAAVPVFNQGVTMLEAGDKGTALAKFLEASEIDPDFPEAARAVAAVAMEVEDYAAAADAAENLIRLQPDNVDAIGTAYYAEFMMDDVDRMIPAARRLAEANPEVVSNQMLQHADVLFREDEFSAARSLLGVIIEKEPDLAPAYLQLGLTCNMQQDGACAIDALEKFLELAPDDPEAATAQSLLDYLKN